MNRRRCAWVVTSLCLFNLGCNLPAQFVWSPDGSRAAYRCGTRAYLVSTDGALLKKLGPSLGGFAWSADGKRLFYATANKELEAGADGNGKSPRASAASISREWFAGPEPAQRPVVFKSACAVHVIEPDGGQRASKELCALPGVITHVALSADEQWLAVMVVVNREDPDRPDQAEQEELERQWLELYAVSVRTGAAYYLACPATPAVAFLGKNRVAYVERLDDILQVARDRRLSGRLVEVVLDESHAAMRPARHAPRFLTPGVPMWLRPHRGDLWMLTVPAPQPGDNESSTDTDPPATLYRYAESGNKLHKLATDLAPALGVSPDGQRLLLVRRNPDDSRELVVMKADGSVMHSVRGASESDVSMPLWPSWRDDRHFVIASADKIAQDDKEKRQYYAVEEYVVEPSGAPRRTRVISEKWDRSMLPHVEEGQFEAARTVPAPLEPAPVK